MAAGLDALRPVLEAAVSVARRVEAVEDVPTRLRPILKFKKLPDAALATVRKVLDSDDVFRAVVGAEVDEHDVGRAGWLYVHRPDGWVTELGEIEARVHEQAERERAAREDREARRRADAAEAAALQAADKIATLEREVAALVDALAAEGEARRRAESEVADALRATAGSTAERDRAVRELKAVERLAQDRLGALRSAQGRVRALEAEAEGARDAPAEPRRETGPDLAAMGRRIRDARDRAAALVTGLDAIADGLQPLAVPDRRRSPTDRTRKPAALPPGVLEDSPEAADHLVRVAGARLYVDGYNVAMAAWDCPIAEQRRRLVAALDALSARCGLGVVVVFDSASGGEHSGRGSRGVDVRFAPDGVEADDVLIEIAGRRTDDEVVLVASSDRRVRDGCREAGANVLSAEQLIGLLR